MKKRTKRRLIKFTVSFSVILSLLTLGTFAATNQNQGISITPNGVQFTSGSANSLEILAVLTIVAIAPSILIMMTSFTRIVIVLSFVRNALGLQQTPPNQVLVGIAIFLTLFVMSPTIDTINKTAYQPLSAGTITTQQAYTNTMKPLRQFMFKQTETTSLNTFENMAGMKKPGSLDGIPSRVLIPAFIISELKRAFMMGFIIYLPFLIIDLIVSSTLMSMGMIMLPPMMISLPLKLALFVLVDGWGLTAQSLVQSFH